MTDDEIPTEERLQSAIDLYEHDISEWGADILLDELERMYSLREQVNDIIKGMKRLILEATEVPA